VAYADGLRQSFEELKAAAIPPATKPKGAKQHA
jgi:hypothetical protein